MTRQMWSSRPSGVSPGKQVDDGVLVDPQRREEHRARPPLVDSDGREAEVVLVPRERGLDVVAVQDEVVELGDGHCAGAHGLSW